MVNLRFNCSRIIGMLPLPCPFELVTLKISKIIYAAIHRIKSEQAKILRVLTGMWDIDQVVKESFPGEDNWRESLGSCPAMLAVDFRNLMTVDNAFASLDPVRELSFIFQAGFHVCNKSC